MALTEGNPPTSVRIGKDKSSAVTKLNKIVLVLLLKAIKLTNRMESAK